MTLYGVFRKPSGILEPVAFPLCADCIGFAVEEANIYAPEYGEAVAHKIVCVSHQREETCFQCGDIVLSSPKRGAGSGGNRFNVQLEPAETV